MGNKIILILKIIFKVIKALRIVLSVAFKVISRLLYRVYQIIMDKLRFSITFKITITYALLFLLIFCLMSAGIMVSFRYYIQNNNTPENYLLLLGAILGIFNIVGLISIIFFGSKASRKLLAPIKVMTSTVKEISINVLDKRLDVSGSKDELKDLAKTFNDMLNRIQKSVEQQNQFVSDASHELRTPIAVIQGYADLLDRWGKDDSQVLEESISAIKGEAESMKSLVEKLLFLARGDKNTQRVEMSDFALNEVVNEILKETKLIDKSHNIINDQNEQFIIHADPKLIKEAMRIFIDNSIKFTPAGGTIKLNSYIKNKRAFISIEDTGIGISQEDLPYIFNRFYRADKSRNKSSGGTGLGLAIAKWIIDNHYGKIDVWSELNAGTLVRIELPLCLNQGR
ncbi:histidine kinase [Desulfofarcimen acetoxidans DSM 771]|uniref:histidine kinase n=1 Tax=Desulfofarcimen acetoxidans (strain ATCC 49208 / DSM 771 / KCTC 5769 / VKM B-1644 / 5575) TaxID=485916 RepID=C8W3M0_DESAS|nr:HAMP domain-containing sensor histidine kinase [Desulfofarcimen acetoxidans]ACV63806.1 histidine kinase [Desulfofarcimen acetoxidans DSM 771]